MNELVALDKLREICNKNLIDYVIQDNLLQCNGNDGGVLLKMTYKLIVVEFWGLGHVNIPYKSIDRFEFHANTTGIEIHTNDGVEIITKLW
ncbi:MAG: hypothetical protein M0R51_09680 [Clostridia bacterium]|jgi:hypothetical protein|nr:hypothetical protein [Clostridia bacterium]